MQHNDDLETVTLDKSVANKAAMDDIKADRDIPIQVRQVRYLNNIVEQDHRAVKRITRPMLGFKAFQSAQTMTAFLSHEQDYDCTG
jgi:putative transposase